jgi:diaminopimelate decarboxylase
LILESGRYLVALCGIYVTRVLYTKESYGKRFVITDGGIIKILRRLAVSEKTLITPSLSMCYAKNKGKLFHKLFVVRYVHQQMFF